jgi:hypothetical protein
VVSAENPYACFQYTPVFGLGGVQVSAIRQHPGQAMTCRKRIWMVGAEDTLPRRQHFTIPCLGNVQVPPTARQPRQVVTCRKCIWMVGAEDTLPRRQYFTILCFSLFEITAICQNASSSVACGKRVRAVLVEAVNQLGTPVGELAHGHVVTCNVMVADSTHHVVDENGRYRARDSRDSFYRRHA